ncbi:hypothetical protein H6F43_16145 [Leptolyngbya sp. FACHB-36]|uniref:hypothetical protein n=1 Tax=Leptolyngbya sp. FACHB-36 TaxID=2692808 RepID=UPI0016809E06|nr:hypothetical protein [Leptolyngbya sp. FACHB-36]MBD2021712.1 hypothetical protein [Leptolyngbya sp. FACHB-36]
MNTDFEQKIWRAGIEKYSYSEKEWKELIKALLDDFQQFIDQSFERTLEAEIDVLNPQSPSFSQWIWTQEEKPSPLSIVWTGVIGGQMVGTENGEDFFQVSLTLFLFEAADKKRICLTTGESVLEFTFERDTESHGYWRGHGWREDEWGEWEDVAYE